MTLEPLTPEEARQQLTASLTGMPQARSVPVRYWPNPNTMLLGYMDISPADTIVDTARYTLTFRMSPLTEPPRYDIRFDQENQAA